MRALHYPRTIPWVPRCIELDHGGISFQLQHVSNQRPPRKDWIWASRPPVGLANKLSRCSMQFLQVEMPKFQDKMLEFSSGFNHFQLPRIGSFPIGKARKPRNPRNTGAHPSPAEMQHGSFRQLKELRGQFPQRVIFLGRQDGPQPPQTIEQVSPMNFGGPLQVLPSTNPWQIITWFLVGELVQKLCCLLNRLCQSTVNPVMSFKAWPV